MNQENKYLNTLIFKNIPKELGNIQEFCSSLKILPKHIKSFGRKRCLLIFETQPETEAALKQLREYAGADGETVLNIAVFSATKETEDVQQPRIAAKTRKTNNKKLQTDGTSNEQTSPWDMQQLNKYVKKLYALEDDLNFDQAPLPYLKYSYPPVNKYILDNICVELLNNNKFYTQVLHLMNRMNLEPPFEKAKEKYVTLGKTKEAATQTEQQFLMEICAAESELESSDNELIIVPKENNQLKRKPTNLQDEQYKKKAKNIIKNVQKMQSLPKKISASRATFEEVFESDRKLSHNKAAHVMSVTKVIQTAKMQQSPLTTLEDSKPSTSSISTYLNTTSKLKIPVEWTWKKLNENEIMALRVYKNYQKGMPSNKLYIKNLHKDVTTDDLLALYEKYSNNINIKLMQHGRMKGQAFATFTMQGEQQCSAIEKALNDTNGLVFIGDKPMVVSYGQK